MKAISFGLCISSQDLRSGSRMTLVMEFFKAFDNVCTLSYLTSLGIAGWLTIWIWNFLTSRLLAVVVNGGRSELVCVMPGVLQFSKRGSVVFLHYLCNFYCKLILTLKLLWMTLGTTLQCSRSVQFTTLQYDSQRSPVVMHFHPYKYVSFCGTRRENRLTSLLN